jgi:hypothetical protein
MQIKTGKPSGDVGTAAEDHTVDSINQMYAALRACWVLPPKDKGASRQAIHHPLRLQA